MYTLKPIALLLLIASEVTSQELLKNGPFESIEERYNQECAVDVSLSRVMTDWQCLHSVDGISHPTYWVAAAPHSGEAMTGLWLLDKGEDYPREYLYQKLQDSLKAGRPCTLSFWFHFRKLDRYFLKHLQFKCSAEAPCLSNDPHIEGETFTIPLAKENFTDDAWHYCTFEFTPSKPWKYFIFGIFDPTPKTIKKRVKGKWGVYLYLDDFSFAQIPAVAQPPITPKL